MSEFIVWATQELERFGTVFRRQGDIDTRNFDMSLIKSSNQNTVFYCNDFRTIAECLEIARAHCNVLEEKGLLLAFFLWQMFRPNVITLIENYCTKMESSLSRQIVDDPWMSHNHWIVVPNSGNNSNESGESNNTNVLQLTDSAKTLYTLTEKFTSDMLNIGMTNDA